MLSARAVVRSLSLVIIMRCRSPVFLASMLVACSLALAAPPPEVGAQDTAAVRAMTVRQKQDVDSILKDKTRPSYTTRATTRLKARADSILAAAQVKPAPPKPDSLPPQPGPVAASIVVHGTGPDLAVGSQMQLSAIVYDASGAVITTAPVAWSTTTPAIADLSGTGLLTGKSAGSDTVMARAGNVFVVRVTNVTGTTPNPPNPPPVDTTTVITSNVALPAELPRQQYDPSYPVAVRQVRIPAGADLQAALNAAQPGDELRIAPDATFVGNYVLPNKGASSAWIVLRTDVDDVALGAAGTRMTPARAATLRLAKILTPSNETAIITAAGAHHWRLTGLEVGGTAAASEISGIVRLGALDASEPTAAALAHDLVLDRVYIHGTPTQAVRRCVLLSSGATAIEDSWLSECHSNNGDSQAILGLGGSGPYRISNNLLSGGHEVVMFGGGDPVVKNLVASDISITRNDITRPVSDRGVWQVKNCLELKSASRVLIEGNVLHNNWADAQTGYCLLIKSVNQDGGCSSCGSTDVTVRRNWIKDTGAGVNIAGHPEVSPVVVAARMTLSDNLVDSINVGLYSGPGIPLQLLDQATDVGILHNTFTLGGGNTISLDGVPMVRLAIIESAFAESGYGVRGSGTGTGISALAAFAPGGAFAGNMLVGATCSWYPAGTLCPSSWPATMPLGADGRAVGVDRAAVAAATSGVVISSGLASPLRLATARQTGWKPTSERQRQINTTGKVRK
jgi:hypothetical protein